MANNISTIQLRNSVKQSLDRLKEKNQSYEEIILVLMGLAEKCKRDKKELLIEGYKEMAEENLKISKEFEAIENLKEWEW